MPQTIMAAPCCCGGPEQMYIAYPCWSKQGRTFTVPPPPQSPGAVQSFTANGSSPQSSNPPAGTVSKVVLIGAGGAGNGNDSGGGGAYVESQVALPATQMEIRVAKGGPIDNTSGGAPFGGAQGASSTRWGGGASAVRINVSTNFIAAGGGAAGSSNFTDLLNLTSRGGDAGISLSKRPAIDISVAGGSTTTNGGAGGVSGGNPGLLGTLPDPGNGGAGAGGVNGGGGGGGGRAAGGGGGSRSFNGVTLGGAGTGGSSLTNDIFLAHEAFSGYAQASPFTSITDLRSTGDGGEPVGYNGKVVFEWRACEDCPCPEMPAGIPPVLHVCLTQSQVNALMGAAGDNVCNVSYLAFEYKGWPFYLVLGSSAVTSPRPCSRRAQSSDISGGKWVAWPDYCCRIWKLPKVSPYDGLCTPKCAVGECPGYIYMCDEYRSDLGLPACGNAYDPLCIHVQYAGCNYSFSQATTFNADCGSESYTPLNVGSGFTVVDCVVPVEDGYWTVGPNVFNGGLQLNDSVTARWNATGFSWGDSKVTTCVGDVGDWNFQFTMFCMFVPHGAKSNPACSFNLRPRACGDVNPFGEMDSTLAVVYQGGLCASPPPPCGDICVCWKELASCELTVGSSAPDPNDPGLVWTPGLTITRNCPHPACDDPGDPPCSWVGVDGGTSSDSAVISIDSCIFQGNGTPADFAAKINQVLGDRLTASGTGAFWLGPRWGGGGVDEFGATYDYPFDPGCCRYGGQGDLMKVLSVTPTTAVIGFAYSTYHRLVANVVAGANEYDYSPCNCNGGSAACAVFTSYYYGPEFAVRPDQQLLMASMGPLTWDTLLYTSGGTPPWTSPSSGTYQACGNIGSGQLPWTPPATITLT